MANLSDKVSQGTVPAAELTKRTREIDIGAGGENKLSGLPAGWSENNAKISFRADSDGQWYIDSVKVMGTATTTTFHSISLTDILTMSVGDNYPLTPSPSDAQGARAWIGSGANTLTIDSATTTTSLRVSGENIPIQALPDYAIPYLENEIAVNAYIPEATSTDAGLSHYRVFKAVDSSGAVVGSSGGVVKFQTVSKDLDGDYSTSTGLYTVPKDGDYWVSASVLFTAVAGAAIYVNST